MLWQGPPLVCVSPAARPPAATCALVPVSEGPCGAGGQLWCSEELRRRSPVNTATGGRKEEWSKGSRRGGSPVVSDLLEVCCTPWQLCCSRLGSPKVTIGGFCGAYLRKSRLSSVLLWTILWPFPKQGFRGDGSSHPVAILLPPWGVFQCDLPSSCWCPRACSVTSPALLPGHR